MASKLVKNPSSKFHNPLAKFHNPMLTSQDQDDHCWLFLALSHSYVDPHMACENKPATAWSKAASFQRSANGFVPLSSRGQAGNHHQTWTTWDGHHARKKLGSQIHRVAGNLPPQCLLGADSWETFIQSVDFCWSIVELNALWQYAYIYIYIYIIIYIIYI